MGKLKTRPLDVSELLDDEDTISHFLEEAFASSDAGHILKALGTVARARNMSKLARDTGMSRAALYRALNGEHAEFATVLKVASALGIEITVKPKLPDAA